MMFKSYQQLSVLFMIFLMIGLSIGQVCNFDDKCAWNIRQGFVITDYHNITQGNHGHDDVYTGLQETSGNFALFSINQSSRGKLKSVWTSSTSLSDSNICLSALVYLGVINETDNAVDIIMSLVPANGAAQRMSVNASAIRHREWFPITSEFKSPLGSFRLIIDVTLKDTNAFFAIDNITVNTSCHKDKNCLDTEKFVCHDGSCVQWDQVCNQRQDCPDGEDEEKHLCDELPIIAKCTFENGSCGWINVDRDSGIDWTRQSGPSPTRGTGPPSDHTTGDKGHYMYIESGDGGIFDVALYQSPVLPAIPVDVHGNCKLRFFYYMIGRNMGTLEVTVTDICDGFKAVPLWSKEGHQEAKWLFAEVAITNTTKSYFLQFKGSAGLLDHGDIAIDDISLSPECFGIGHNATHFLGIEETSVTLTLNEFLKDKKTYCQITTTEKPTVPNTITFPSETSSETGIFHKEPDRIPIENIVIITIAAVALAIVMGSALLCLALRKRKERSMQSAHLEMVSNISDDNCNTVPVQPSSFDMQLKCAVTELNPNYDFITAKYPEQQLREIPRNKLKLIRLLGQGAFGEVYEGRLKNMCANVSELPVAVKTLPALSTEQAETDFLMEAVIISKFMHKNVVKCLGVCFEEHPRYIILELLQGGDLKTFLRDFRPKMDQPCLLTMRDLVKLALDIANGCRHLEEKHFVHRDVAARNCLLTSREPERMAKIADFGMSRDIYSADYYRKGGKTMLPIKWMPPEAFLDGVFTTKTDVWSFGVLLWEIFTLGYMPYPGQTNSDVMHYVASGGRLDPPENCPARLNKIMIMCWNSVADIRPSFNEIIEHLDMCLQDPEVMDVDPSDFNFPMGECFKDASTLAKSATSHSNSVEMSPDVPSETDTAGFGRHMESQSREPLLLATSDNV